MAKTRTSCTLLLLVMFASSLAAQLAGRPPILMPRSDSSPDGRWTLSLEPSRRDGGGPAHYVCLHDGEEAWSGDRPWALWESLVTDEGVVAGYAYSEGQWDPHAKGDFHAVILGSDGRTLLDEVHAREHSRFLHSLPDPVALGVFHQPDLQHVVFRIADSDVNRRSEEWWCFSIAGTTEIRRVRPRGELVDRDHGVVIALRAVRGTPLTVAEWWSYPWTGVSVTLHDSSLQAVWDSGAIDTFASDDEGRYDRRDAVFAHGTLLDDPIGGHFTVGLPGKGERVSFSVERSGQSWVVHERERAAWSLSDGLEPTMPSFAEMGVEVLEDHGTFSLAGEPQEASAVRDIQAFACATPGVLRVVRGESDASFTLLRVDDFGEVLHERRIELPGRLVDESPHFWSIGPTSWLATQSPAAEGAVSLGWTIDEESGKVERLSGFESPWIRDVAALGEGHFVVLATLFARSTMTSSLTAFDPQAHVLWRRTEDGEPEDESGLLSPAAVAVTDEGRVAVVDSVRHTLQAFDADGTFVASLDLDDAWGRTLSYPSGLRADVDGGLLLHDLGGASPLLRVRRDGALRAQLSPRFADGRVTDELARLACVAPDGRLWTTDGERLLRLDEQGVVDRQLGAPLAADTLAKPSACAIDVFGRVLVQDAGTGAVHVFDGEGRRLFVCRPEPTDFGTLSPIAHLSATPDGGVVAEVFMKGYVRFGPRGERLVKIGDVGENLVFSPVDDAAYAGHYDSGFVRLDANLALRAIFDRAPNGAWITDGDSPAVAPDGAVAAVIDSPVRSAGGAQALVLFETADPELGRAVELPDGTPRYQLALGRTWAVLSNYERDALLVRRADGALRRVFVPDVEASGDGWSFGFDPDSDELVAVHAKTRVICRLALP